MKITFIAKAISVVLACSILALFLVPSGFAYKVGVSGSNPASIKSCNSKPSTFTVFPFAKLTTNQNGSLRNLEVYVSNLDGDCTARIYSSNSNGYNTVPDNVNGVNNSTIALR